MIEEFATEGLGFSMRLVRFPAAGLWTSMSKGTISEASQAKT